MEDDSHSGFLWYNSKFGEFIWIVLFFGSVFVRLRETEPNAALDVYPHLITFYYYLTAQLG